MQGEMRCERVNNRNEETAINGKDSDYEMKNATEGRERGFSPGAIFRSSRLPSIVQWRGYLRLHASNTQQESCDPHGATGLPVCQPDAGSSDLRPRRAWACSLPERLKSVQDAHEQKVTDASTGGHSAADYCWDLRSFRPVADWARSQAEWTTEVRSARLSTSSRVAFAQALHAGLLVMRVLQVTGPALTE